jgi:hypothetical protein
MASVTSYREASWLKTRTFELTSESVVVRSWGFAGHVRESEIAMRLMDLAPEIAGRSWMKRDDQHTALFGVIAAICIAGVSWLAVTAGGRDPAWLLMLPAMLGALVLVACVAVFDPRRVEYVLFNNRASQVVLSVGRIGSDAQRFDAFIASLQTAISVASSAKSQN